MHREPLNCGVLKEQRGVQSEAKGLGKSAHQLNSGERIYSQFRKGGIGAGLRAQALCQQGLHVVLHAGRRRG